MREGDRTLPHLLCICNAGFTTWRTHYQFMLPLFHEAPSMNLVDQTELLLGMVLTIERGLYQRDLGGIRHSDTVAVTDEGMEVLTYYLRNLASLTIDQESTIALDRFDNQ